jgi:NAD(P)-dependent dehydrogenase (short-subunit alcohol dehydrogenase family)
MQRLSGRSALITGGASGIGRATVQRFLAEGARVAVTDIQDAAGEELVAEATAAGGEAIFVHHDVADEQSWIEALERVEQAFGGLDILFNNAGASWGAPFDDFPELGWDKVMDINVKSVFFLTQRLIKLLEAAATPEQNAKVINIGSIDGQHVSPIETYSYAASKAGVLHLTRMMAKNLAPRHIAVNAIAPGYFPSKMTAGIADMINEESLKVTPMARWGTPSDMAGVALFLGSQASAYLCGSTITVDGGYATTA